MPANPTAIAVSKSIRGIAAVHEAGYLYKRSVDFPGALCAESFARPDRVGRKRRHERGECGCGRKMPAVCPAFVSSASFAVSSVYIIVRL